MTISPGGEGLPWWGCDGLPRWGRAFPSCRVGSNSDTRFRFSVSISLRFSVSSFDLGFRFSISLRFSISNSLFDLDFRFRFSIPVFDFDFVFFDLDSRFRVSIRVFGFDVVVQFRRSTSALSSAPIFGSEIGSGCHLRVFGLLRSPLWGAVPRGGCMVDIIG